MGALLGLAIGFVGGFFTSSDTDTQASVTEQKTSVEEEKAKKAEAKKDAEKAAKEAKQDEENKADKADQDTTKDDSQSADKTDASSDEDSDKDSQETVEGIGTGTVATGGAGLNLRADASTDSNIVGTVNNGDSLTIIAESNGFYQVQTPSGQTAWVSAQFVTMN